jgi:hypothetical protein
VLSERSSRRMILMSRHGSGSPHLAGVSEVIAVQHAEGFSKHHTGRL